MRRIGIFGGSFDPVHIGHLILAEWARLECQLDRVVFIPSFASKNKQPAAGPEDRKNMLLLAIEGNDAFALDDREIKRNGVSYTYDTAVELREEFKNDELYFIAGADIITTLPAWKNSEKLVKLLKFIIAVRPGYAWEEQDGFWPITIPGIEVSSTMIRQRIAKGKSIRYLVPDKVCDYIEKNGLYKGKGKV